MNEPTLVERRKRQVRVEIERRSNQDRREFWRRKAQQSEEQSDGVKGQPET